jgi:hypothetical protein
MSMILEAMKRSKEGEAKTSDVPTVDTVHYVPEPESRFSRWQVIGMLAGVVVVMTAVLTVMWSSEPESHATASSATPLAAPSATPSAEVAKTPASVSQAADQQAERRQASQPEAVRPVTAAMSSSNTRQRSSVESPVKQRLAPKTNQDPMPARASASMPTAEQRERPVVMKSTPSSSRMTTQAAQPATSSDELRAIYQALNEEVSQNTVPNKSEPSRDEGENRASRQLDGTYARKATAGRSDVREGEPVREDGVGSSPEEPDEAPPIDFADILAAAQEELGVKPLVESSEPLLETLSQQIKDDIPSLIYSEHRYNPAGDSSVTLNGKVVKERQRVGAFTVVEILPDSVVLRWREAQFRVRARNSWVNM